MKIGAHTSTAGGYSEAVKRVSQIGGNCLQIFSTSPRSWKPADPDEKEKDKFKEAMEDHSVSPVYFHASYLVNLAGSEEVQEKSVGALVAELQVAGDFGVKGTTVHLGSFKKGRSQDGQKPLFEEDESAYKDLLANIKEILKETPEETLFIIENMGTRKIGMSLEEIAFIVEKLNSSRVRVCLDTCHLHAAGVDISTADRLDSFLGKFDDLMGLSMLEFFHINDSKDDFGSLRDRHENIGKGEIPQSVFSLLLNHSKTKDLPFITEVPGFEGKGPDKKSIDIIKGFLEK
ncbi:MAG: deoxyribonuclease IV [Patescibacteria group bacterium]